jgi:uncharacterized protein YndB with AHSA1/START domain
VNDTLRTTDGRGVLRMQRRLRHQPEKVWRAITDPAHLRQWFPSEVEVDLRVNGKLRFVFANDEGPTMDGVVTELDPPRVFAYTWGDDLLHWEVRPDADGCLLILTHTFADRAGAASFASGWQICIKALAMVLAGRPVEVSPDSFELHEKYVEAFGLGQGSAEATADGWRVRFERQLTRPVDVVWAALTEATTPQVGDAPPGTFTAPGVPAGAVTAVEAPTLLEYDWLHEGAPAGRVRGELTAGTGHGARLILTQTGPARLADEQAVALAAWQEQIQLIARRLSIR